jgi:formamidopyrimidine-DNA glycosylase
MPELPDVASYKGYLDSTSLHKRIKKTSITDERILEGVSRQKVARRLKGSELESTCRHGKYLFVELEKDGWLVLHFGMTGDLGYYGEGSDRPEHARLILDFENGYHLAMRCALMLGRVSYTDNRDAFIEARDLGPDAMADDLGRDTFSEMLSGRRGAIKPLLMNQSFVAGIGNVWADEILWQAGVHPARKADRLSAHEAREVFRVMRRVFRTAKKRGGDAREMPRSYLVHVRGKDGRCPKCGGPLERISMQSRTGYFCPRRQRPHD